MRRAPASSMRVASFPKLLSLLRGTGGALLAFMAPAVPLPAQVVVRSQHEQGIASGNQFVVTFLPPYFRVHAPDPPELGHYIWRFTVEADVRFSIVLAADTAMRTNNLASIVRGSTLRRCRDADEESALDCRDAVRGSAQVRNGMIAVTITEPSLAAVLEVNRPVHYWRYSFEPGGRYSIDRMQFEYARPVRR